MSDREPAAREQLADERATFEALPVREVDLDGVRWRTVEAGKGELAFVLLPGWFVGAASWLRVVPRLAGAGRVVALDYPRVRFVEALADGLARLVDAPEVCLVGQSVGGLYARACAPAFGSRLRGLVLSHASLPRRDTVARVRRGNLAGRLAPASLHRRQWARRIATERSEDDPVTAFWRELYLERARELDKRDVVAWGASYLDLLRQPEPPRAERILVIDSDDDPVIGAEEREALRAACAPCESRRFAGTGHATPELAPAAFAESARALARV